MIKEVGTKLWLYFVKVIYRNECANYENREMRKTKSESDHLIEARIAFLILIAISQIMQTMLGGKYCDSQVLRSAFLIGLMQPLVYCAAMFPSSWDNSIHKYILIKSSDEK